MKPFLIGSGWKMNNTVEESLALLKGLQAELGAGTGIPLFVLPPFTALQAVGTCLQGGWIQYGAQNMHWEEAGAYTGEIAAPMLKELGCTYVEVNHQERRAYFGEANRTANLKIHTALRFGLKPILCFGEEEVLNEEQLRSFLQGQIAELVAGVSPSAVSDIIFAYEPRWAIGKAQAAPVGHIAMVHRVVRGILGEMHGRKTAQKTVNIYGGSVDRANATAIALQEGVDGLFIGRAGLEAKTFAAIIRTVSAALQEE